MSDSNYEPFPNKTIRDWVLGIGEFSEENLRKSREETAKRMVATVMEAMEKRLVEAFSLDTNHDAVPAAKAQSCEKSRPQAVSELGNPVRHSTQDGTGNTPEPVAWAVRKKNPPVGESPVLCWCESDMRSVENSLPDCTVIPLYHQQPPSLTQEERSALQAVVSGSGVLKWQEIEAVVLSLLERTELRS